MSGRSAPLRRAGTAGVAAAGVLPAAWTAYLAVLSVAALRRPAAPTGASPRTADELVVLVPAHDEQELLGRCLDSLAAQDLPASSYRVVVIADNCTDRTAEIAAERAAEVLVRTDPASRGKGQALAWAVERLETGERPWDAVVVVDADSVADPGLLSGLAAELARGADVVQGEYLVLREGDGAASELRAAAFLLFHRVRFRGRAVLGLPCSLVGNGMLLRRSVLRDHPWRAFSSTEDLEHTLDLRLAGVRPVFAEHARVRAPVLAHGTAAATQRTRWEGGRAHLVRTRLPGLLAAAVRDPRRGLWDAALDLSVPPIGLLAPAVVVGGAAGAGLTALRLVGPVAGLPWLVSAVALPVHVLVGLRAADAPAATWAALRSAPGLVARDLAVRLRLLRGTGAATWTRTQRPGETGRRTG